MKNRGKVILGISRILRIIVEQRKEGGKHDEKNEKKNHYL